MLLIPIIFCCSDLSPPNASLQRYRAAGKWIPPCAINQNILDLEERKYIAFRKVRGYVFAVVGDDLFKCLNVSLLSGETFGVLLHSIPKLFSRLNLRHKFSRPTLF